MNGASARERLQSRTAVLMPICNENVDRVFAGLEASYRSLEATGEVGQFDFFVLSDTGDPDTQIDEELAWAETCRRVEGCGRIFYRHRRNPVKRKSGNIADFLRRWGRNYDYMVVFDADSVMAGETLVRLAKIMERRPQVGIVQTLPATVNRESLFARIQQFAGSVYGPMLAAGLEYWQLGEAYYWGHNAILRVAPFIENCGLRRLPGKEPLGGEILSHDFVEAALMGRAGFEVWLLRDGGGSYEETPPTLLDELKRDRRWLQGNLQHLRLIGGDGLRAGHRDIFAMGVMSYASALFWFMFLILCTVEVALEAFLPPVYFSSEPSLFPIWPRWHPEWAIALLSTTAVVLFLPKLLSFLLIIQNRQTALFGGLVPLGLSILLEIVVSTLLAPVRMWFHSKFVLITIMGRRIQWGSQCRDDSEIGWREAIAKHGFSVVFALAWMFGVSRLNPSFSWWLMPIAVSLVLSAPVSVYLSRTGLGQLSRRWRLFLIPEEVQPPELLQQLQTNLQQRMSDKRRRTGFEHAIFDSYANALHIAMLRGKGPKSPGSRARNSALCARAALQGPANLQTFEKKLLLRDAVSMEALHRWLARDAYAIAEPLMETESAPEAIASAEEGATPADSGTPDSDDVVALALSSAESKLAV